MTFRSAGQSANLFSSIHSHVFVHYLSYIFLYTYLYLFSMTWFLLFKSIFKLYNLYLLPMTWFLLFKSIFKLFEAFQEILHFFSVLIVFDCHYLLYLYFISVLVYLPGTVVGMALNVFMFFLYCVPSSVVIM